jgi:ubiquinone/menaquinone biosynthesis C-methylase UbiE
VSDGRAREVSGADTTYEYYGGTREGEKKLWADLNAWMHMQAVQWEPAGEKLLAELGDGTGLRAVDMGCGPLGWLRLLSRWVGPSGEVVGTEAGEATAEPARHTIRSEGLTNVSIVVDDIFDSRLPERSFDLVHARFMLGPLGRPEEQIASYRRLVKPGGLLVLEEPDMGSWSFNPDAPANRRLNELGLSWAKSLGRDLSTGRQIRTILRAYSEEPVIRAHVLVLPPGHVYRALALMFATAGRDALAKVIGAEEIDSLLAQAEEELRDPEIWCTSLILVQGYARLP